MNEINSPKRKTIGASIIACNEQEMIEDCLKSLQGIDEIVVVLDTVVNDKTEEICRKYTDKIYKDYIWIDDYSDKRNYAISKSTTDWILTIDCDERLDANCIDKIKERIQIEKYQTINITMHSGSTHFISPRIYKNDGIVHWQNPWHNCLSVVDESFLEDVGILYLYSPAHYADPHRCLRMGEKAVAKNPTSSRLHFYLAREYGYEKRYEDAIKTFAKYRTLNPWSVEECFSWYLEAQYWNHLGDWDKAKDCCLKAIKMNANFKGAMLFLSTLCGPGNAAAWQKYAKLATEESILFPGE